MTPRTLSYRDEFARLVIGIVCVVVGFAGGLAAAVAKGAK